MTDTMQPLKEGGKPVSYSEMKEKVLKDLSLLRSFYVSAAMNADDRTMLEEQLGVPPGDERSARSHSEFSFLITKTIWLLEASKFDNESPRALPVPK